MLTIAPILKVVDPKKEFTVCTYACKEWVGGVLMQEGKVIAYESLKLKYYEQKYFTYDLELTPMVHSLKVS